MQRDLLRTVEYGLADTTNGRQVDGNGTDLIPALTDAAEPFRSQEALYEAYSKEISQTQPQ